MPNSDGSMTRYEYNKMQQRCVQCGKRDAYTLNGRAICSDCYAKSKEWYNKNREKVNRTTNARYHRRKSEFIAQGLCSRCGQRPAEDGYKMCRKCQEYSHKRYMASRRHEETLLNTGGCTRCHKAEPIEGKRLCANCYAFVCAALKKARAAQSNDKHEWRGYWKGRGDTNGKV